MMGNERRVYPEVNKFVERLSQLDVSGRARLKRNAGKTLAEARNLALFYQILPPGVSAYQEEMYFLAATLLPQVENRDCGNLGYSLRQTQTASNKKGLDRRIEILLDADETQLPFRLRQAIHLLSSNRVSINWSRLLQDLLDWYSPSRFVQKDWARSYFAE